MTAINSTTLPKSILLNQHDDYHSIFHPSVISKMWIHSLGLASVLFMFFLGYVFLESGSFSLLSVSMATAATAAIMIGLSFALSGFCFYFDFLDRKIAYRKYLGLVGFWFALTYSIMLLFVDPNRYFYGFFVNVLSADFILGLTAMSIFTFMALISNNWAMKKLGVKRWRYGLRLGYLAYLLLIIRAMVLDHDIWIAWFHSPVTLPPVRLIISIFATIVLVFRLSMVIKTFFSRIPLPQNPATSS